VLVGEIWRVAREPAQPTAIADVAREPAQPTGTEWDPDPHVERRGLVCPLATWETDFSTLGGGEDGEFQLRLACAYPQWGFQGYDISKRRGGSTSDILLA
jgi:hypothetical protein